MASPAGGTPRNGRRLGLRSPLLWKLSTVHLVVIGLAGVFVWMAIDTLAAGYFAALMSEYNISPTVVHRMFVGAVHRYLLWGALAACVPAFLLSLLLTRRVLAPLTRMADMAEEIARGNYAERLPTPVPGEIGQLADAFNQMAASLERIERLRKSCARR